MKLHGNARTCPKSRRLLVDRVFEQGWSLTQAAEAAGVSERTAAKWVARLRPTAKPACSIARRLQSGSRTEPRRRGSRRSRRCAGCG